MYFSLSPHWNKTFLALVSFLIYGNSFAVEATEKHRLAETVLINEQQAESAIEPLLSTKTDQLIRWGNPAPITSSEQILLDDGSLLVPSQTWTSNDKIRFDQDVIKLNRGNQSIRLAKSDVALIQRQPQQISNTADLLSQRGGLVTDSEEDQVTLVDGDRLEGKIVELRGEELKLELYGETIELPYDRIATLRFGKMPNTVRKHPPARYVVGFVEGSLLKVKSLEISSDRYRIEASASFSIEGDANEIVFVQPFGKQAIYLSDLEPIDYQHTPYLSLRWPYGKDKLPIEGRLKAGGQYFAKGIAMHTASRIVYALDDTIARFQARIGIADASEVEPTSLGSALFRVFLVEAEGIRSIYESPVLRTGDSPVPIDLKVAGARALVLTVDYADGADVGDDALWLDARLVPN